jgi:hypothetical protein
MGFSGTGGIVLCLKGQFNDKDHTRKTGGYRKPEKSGETIPTRAPDNHSPESVIELFSTGDESSESPIKQHTDT